MTESLLPPNRTPVLTAIESALARIETVPVPLAQLWNPETCPSALLPWLAWGLSIDDWRSDWSEGVKRAQIAAAIEIQRHRGTVASVRSAVAAFGAGLAVREWWQMDPPGPPHTFEVVVTVGEAQVAAGLVDQIIAAVTRTKPARAHFTVTQGLSVAATLKGVGRARPAIARSLSGSLVNPG